MSFDEFKNIFEQELSKINITIDEKREETFYYYMTELLKWNEKINVTAIKDEKDFIIKHFVDSLVVSKFIKENDKVLDLGTGGGFPGIPLKIYYENLDIVLLDSVNKKLEVIEDIIRPLNMKKIILVHERAENIGQNKLYRENFDIVTSRAVSNLSTISECMLPLLKKGGKAICMKGPNCYEEIKGAENAINILGGRVDSVEKYILNGEERNLIVIKKDNITIKRYPRKAGIPFKKPL